MTAGGETGVDATLGSSYFDGACAACDEPVPGRVVTVVRLGRPPAATMHFTLCHEHHNGLAAALERLGERREL